MNAWVYGIWHNVVLLSHKREWNNIICSNMDGPKDYYNKWSKLDREKQVLYDITYMWDLKCDINKLIYNTEAGS